MRFASLTTKAITKIATPSGTLPISNHKYPPLPEPSSNMDVPLRRDVIKARAMGKKATIKPSFTGLNLAWGKVCHDEFMLKSVLDWASLENYEDSQVSFAPNLDGSGDPAWTLK